MSKAAYDDERVKINIMNRSSVQANGCWIWQGATIQSGYGTCKYQGKQKLVHRVSALVFNGVPLTSEVIMHTCDNRLCCNPEHLEAGTQQENMIDMKSKGRVQSAVGEH